MDAVRDHALELALVVRHPAPRAAKGVGRADDHGIAEPRSDRLRFVHRRCGVRPRDRLPDLEHQRTKSLAVLPRLNRMEDRPEEFYIVLLKNPSVRELAAQIERGLAAEARQDPVWTFLRVDSPQEFRGEWLDVHG